MKEQKQPSQPQEPSADRDRKSRPGIGSSQGQDRGSSDTKPSPNHDPANTESIVGASTGAFKERP